MGPSLTVVIGGASSGKSAWAEGFVHASGLAKVFVATAQSGDAQMERKIRRHRQARAGQGWRTVEAPNRLPHAVAEIDAEEIALIDCATNWLAHTMVGRRPWRDATVELIGVMTQCPAPLVVVTNELGHGITPADPDTRRFREAHGQMNQLLAEAADVVVMVTAGLPQVLKGEARW